MEHAQPMVSMLSFVSVQSAIERVIDQAHLDPHLTGGRGSSQWLNRITIINRRSSPHLKVLNTVGGPIKGPFSKKMKWAFVP